MELPADLRRRVLELAREAAEAGETPVGALALRFSPEAEHETDRFQIVAAERNRIVERDDATAHAELLAIRAACRAVQNERLEDVWLVSSLEPCMMCAGAIVHARLAGVIFFAPAEKGPGLRRLLADFREGKARLNHFPECIHAPEFQTETAELLRSFFRARRRAAQSNA